MCNILLFKVTDPNSVYILLDNIQQSFELLRRWEVQAKSSESGFSVIFNRDVKVTEAGMQSILWCLGSETCGAAERTEKGMSLCQT